MEPFHEYIAEYQKQLGIGVIQKAYRGLMEYILDLRNHLKSKYPAYTVSGSLYAGYMDMTYFSFFPESIKKRNLKVAVVFLHEEFRFEAWLAGFNRQAQSEYWQLFQGSGWKKYPLVAPGKGVDAILVNVLADNPNFRDLAALTRQIELGTLQLIRDVEAFLAGH